MTTFNNHCSKNSQSVTSIIILLKVILGCKLCWNENIPTEVSCRFTTDIFAKRIEIIHIS